MNALKICQIGVVIFLFSCTYSTDNNKVSDKNDSINGATNQITQNELDSSETKENWNKFEQSFILNNYLLTTLPNNEFSVIEYNTAIFISPDSLEVEAMKKELGEAFYTVADDNNYYDYEASQFLKKKGIPCLYPKTRYLKFIGTNNRIFNFDTKAKSARGWTTILFRTDSLPRIVNPVEIEEEYKKYFKN